MGAVMMFRDGSNMDGGGVSAYEAPVNETSEYEESESTTSQKMYADVGPRHLEFVPMTEVHLLEQPRRQYDPHAIESLARAMVPDWNAFDAATTLEEIEASIDQYNPALLNRVSPEYLPTYLEDHARLYQIETPVLYKESDTATTDINGGGHTRYLAYEWLLKYKGLTKESGRMLFNVRYDMSHAATLAMQIRENVKSNPSSEDLAFIIERIANDHEDIHGEKPTPKYLSQYTGLSEDVIRDGLAFTSLPRSIQDYVGDPRKERKKKKSGAKIKQVVPYSMLVRLRPLQDAIATKYVRDNGDTAEYSPQARDTHVESKLQRVASDVAKFYIQGRKADAINKYVSDLIKTAKNELKAEQLDLIYVEDAYDVKKQQARAQAALAQRCIETLRLLAEQGNLEPKYADKLRDVYELFEQDTQIEDDSQESLFD